MSTPPEAFQLASNTGTVLVTIGSAIITIFLFCIYYRRRRDRGQDPVASALGAIGDVTPTGRRPSIIPEQVPAETSDPPEPSSTNEPNEDVAFERQATEEQ
jgi:hypothetical protein